MCPRREGARKAEEMYMLSAWQHNDFLDTALLYLERFGRVIRLTGHIHIVLRQIHELLSSAERRMKMKRNP
jgi:ATP-dependent Zn protease